ncbi:MAG: ribbon-helix-helix domain-containing protein [Pseudomonadota bacterium]
MSASEIRINARLTGEDARRFRELQRRDHRSASDVIREAVREYHARHVKPRKSAWEIMSQSGFIGCGEGPEDLSARYKEYLAEDLERDYLATQRKTKP